MNSASSKLTTKQRIALEYMINGKNIFITGPAGTGKSTVISLFRKVMKHKVIAVTSMTGISAVILGGTTLHSYLGIGIGNAEWDILRNRIKTSKNTAGREYLFGVREWY